MSDKGQVSETSQLNEQGFAQDTPPGTNDGVPTAEAAQQEANGSPRQYGEGEGVMGDE